MRQIEIFKHEFSLISGEIFFLSPRNSTKLSPISSFFPPLIIKNPRFANCGWGKLWKSYFMLYIKKKQKEKNVEKSSFPHS